MQVSRFLPPLSYVPEASAGDSIPCLGGSAITPIEPAGRKGGGGSEGSGPEVFVPLALAFAFLGALID